MITKKTIEELLKMNKSLYEAYVQKRERENWVGYDSEEAESDGHMQGEINMLELLLAGWDDQVRLLNDFRNAHGIVIVSQESMS